jgi:hypothetical protein
MKNFIKTKINAYLETQEEYNNDVVEPVPESSSSSSSDS